MQTSKWNRFVLLLWKNWIIQKRHKFQTVVEILVPVLFALLLVLFRSIVDPDVYDQPRIYEVFNSSARPVQEFHSLGDWSDFFNKNVTHNLAYTPQNDELDKLFKKVEEKLDLNATVALQTAAELEREMLEKNYYAGIEFDDSYKNLKNGELPADFKFSIRFPATLRTEYDPNPLNDNWRTNLLFPQFQLVGPRNNESEAGGTPPGYWEEGFTNLQSAIFLSFAETKLPSKVMPVVQISRFPYPPFIKDYLLEALDAIIPLIIILSFMYPTVNLVKFVTVEKEAQLKEAMKIMGLENWLHWTAWFTKALIFNVITVTLISLVMIIKFYSNSDVAVFTHSDWSVLWVFLLIYSCTTITFAFMVSVFFSKANNAATVTGLIWFIFYVPFTLTEQNYDEMGAIDKLAVCLFSNSAMPFGFRLLLRFEGTGEGLQWSNFFSTVSADDNITFGDINLMLILDTIIYLLIALYVEKINPGDFGVPEKWYFPFTKSFWCGAEPETIKAIDSSDNSDYNNVNEPEPTDKHPGIQIKNLRKVFSNRKVAVDNLTLNMYEDQITVLLGHNGAGKTTTMSMLTGMFPPTSGSAIINGKSILNDLDAVRSSLGLCPQHNVLFSELTVREHIIFYSKLKGLPSSEMKEEIRKYVDLLELQPKMNAQSKTLSGGMKRKLSVGVALCGNSKIVICDEPTSGMDPAARRALWDLLQQEKKGRTILLTTHFMDEADILGDRIAIMSDGVLKACGTSFFLKKRFGIGYRLICVKGPNTSVPNTTHLLRKYIPSIKVCTNIENELTYELNEEYVAIFESMLSDLEKNAEQLGIIGYGVSPSTLEEVFMKVGSDMNKPDILANENSSSTDDISERNMEMPLLSGTKLIQNQFIAMMEKKFFYTLRNWYIILIQVIIPVAFLIMVILISRVFSANSDLPARSLDPSMYTETITLISRANGLTSDYSNIADEYEELFTSSTQKTEIIQTSFVNHIIELSLNIIATINSRYMFGASFERDSITAWFNNAAYHNLPIALGAVHNAVLKGMGCTNCSISITNSPLPYSASAREKISKSGQTLGFQFAINMGLSMAFVAALFVLFYIKERVNRAKLLQMVSGVNIHIYWFSSFLFDFAVHIIISLLTVIVLAIFQEDGYATFAELGRIFLTLICFGFGALPLMYLFSLLFTIPSNGYVRVSLLNIVTGVAFYIVVFVLDALQKEEIANALNWVFSFLPHFSLCLALSNINVVESTTQFCLLYMPTIEAACLVKEECCVPDIFDFEQPGILRNLLFMLITGCVCYGLLILIEMGLLQNVFYKGKTMYTGVVGSLTDENSMDIDVLKEKQRVQNASAEDISRMTLVLRGMTKYYKKFLAVKQISVGINDSECFGLLGVNGAGKTSTFKMLTGDELISSGEAWVKGISLKTDINKVHQIIGYCPQFDALLEDLTGRETLRMFCLLRGVPNNKIKYIIETLSMELNFVKHIDKKIKEYSGGNKRKVSTAISLIGNPVVVYLDEPTTGMDPGAKRQLWDMICRIRNAGKTIVLTSHSMEECEALCTKLAIMVNGEFKCIGSSQYLKNKYSQGYLVSVKAEKAGSPQELIANVTAIKNFIAESFPGAEIREEYQGLITYNIPSTNQKWSRMFGILQSSRKRLKIEDYSLSQTSLEQVFLSFTKYQTEENLKT